MADHVMAEFDCTKNYGAMNIMMRNLCNGADESIYLNCNTPYYGSEEMAKACIPVMERRRGTPLETMSYGSPAAHVYELYPSMSKCNTTDVLSDEGVVFDSLIKSNELDAKGCAKALDRITGQEFEAVMTEHCDVFPDVWSVKKNKYAFLGDIDACDCHDPQKVADQIISRNNHEGEYFVAGIIHDMLGCSIYCATEKTLDDFESGIYTNDILKTFTSIVSNFSLALALLEVCNKYNCNGSF